MTSCNLGQNIEKIIIIELLHDDVHINVFGSVVIHRMDNYIHSIYHHHFQKNIIQTSFKMKKQNPEGKSVFFVLFQSYVLD